MKTEALNSCEMFSAHVVVRDILINKGLLCLNVVSLLKLGVITKNALEKTQL